jgi:hypothetical protein
MTAVIEARGLGKRYVRTTGIAGRWPTARCTSRPGT